MLYLEMNKYQFFIISLFTSINAASPDSKPIINETNEIIVVFLLASIVVVGIILSMFDKR